MEPSGDNEPTRVCKAILKMIQLKKLPPDKVEEYVGIVQRLCGAPTEDDPLSLDDCGLLNISSLDWSSVSIPTCKRLLISLLDAHCSTSLVPTIAAHLYYVTKETEHWEVIERKILDSGGEIPVSLVEMVATRNPRQVEDTVLADLLAVPVQGTGTERWHWWCSQSPRLFRRVAGLLCRATSVSMTNSGGANVLSGVANFVGQVRVKCGDEEGFLRLYPCSWRAVVALMLKVPGDTALPAASALLTKLDPIVRLTVLSHFPHWAPIYSSSLTKMS